MKNRAFFWGFSDTAFVDRMCDKMSDFVDFEETFLFMEEIEFSDSSADRRNYKKISIVNFFDFDLLKENFSEENNEKNFIFLNLLDMKKIGDILDHIDIFREFLVSQMEKKHFFILFLPKNYQVNIHKKNLVFSKTLFDERMHKIRFVHSLFINYPLTYCLIVSSPPIFDEVTLFYEQFIENQKKPLSLEVILKKSYHLFISEDKFLRDFSFYFSEKFFSEKDSIGLDYIIFGGECLFKPGHFEWKKLYSQFLTKIKLNKVPLNGRLEESLFFAKLNWVKQEEDKCELNDLFFNH